MSLQSLPACILNHIEDNLQSFVCPYNTTFPDVNIKESTVITRRWCDMYFLIDDGAKFVGTDIFKHDITSFTEIIAL